MDPQPLTFDDLLDAVGQELHQSGLGEIGPLLARYRTVRAERRGALETLGWSKADVSTLWKVCDRYVDLLIGIDKLMTPALARRGVTPGAHAERFGEFARFLFLAGMLWLYGDEPDPAAPLVGVIELSDAGPLAEGELFRRLLLARDGGAAIMVAATGTLAAGDDAQTLLRRVVPGLSITALTERRDHALESVTRAVLKDLRRWRSSKGQTLYRTVRARVEAEDGRAAPGRPDPVPHAVAVHALETAVKEWGRLDVTDLVTRALAGRLVAPTRLTSRLVDQLRNTARRERHFPDLGALANELAAPALGVRRAPTVLTLQEQDGRKDLEIREEAEPETIDAQRALEAWRAVLEEGDPELALGFEVLWSELQGEKLPALSKRYGKHRKTLAARREAFLDAVRARARLTTE